ncbi:MAG: alanine racemase [Bacillota bacterium]
MREKGIKQPILVLGEFPPRHIKEALINNLRLTVYTEKFASEISEHSAKLGVVANIHVKVNTGLNRTGLSPGLALDFFTGLSQLKNIRLEGAYTHFSHAYLFGNPETRRQLQSFLHIIGEVKKRGLHIPLLHAANTPAALTLPESHLDLARIGVGLVGLYPGEEFKKTVPLLFPLTWKSYICFAHKVRAGEGVGYGGCYRAERDIIIATLPVGTTDGMRKKFEGRAFVRVRGKLCKIIGVNMEMTIIDSGGLEPLEAGDEALILGGENENFIHPEELGHWVGEDPEELLCQLSYRIPRLYIT